jgi:hypothetical protein
METIVRRTSAKPPIDWLKVAGVIAIIAMIGLFAVPAILNAVNLHINFGNQNNNVTGGNNGNNGNEPGTSKFYSQLNGNLMDTEYQQDTLKIIPANGMEMRPSSSDASQIATASWLQSVVDWSKNKNWKNGADQGQGMMSDFITALETNKVRYDRQKDGNSYKIEMPLLKAGTMKAIELNSFDIQNVNFENDAKDFTKVYKPEVTTPPSTGNAGSNAGNVNAGNTNTGTLYTDEPSGSSSGSLYA